MRRRFIRYVWDPYRLVYVPVPIGWQSLWRQGRVWVQGALLGIGLFVGGGAGGQVM